MLAKVQQCKAEREIRGLLGIFRSGGKRVKNKARPAPYIQGRFVATVINVRYFWRDRPVISIYLRRGKTHQGQIVLSPETARRIACITGPNLLIRFQGNRHIKDDVRNKYTALAIKNSGLLGPKTTGYGRTRELLSTEWVLGQGFS
ncbi:hypothetical protein D0S45_03850 [Marinifilum sp. JC120]|nr:hypothetical protein D0S45_03850 [Marinifilum sp. JC120]